MTNPSSAKGSGERVEGILRGPRNGIKETWNEVGGAPQDSFVSKSLPPGCSRQSFQGPL